MKKKFSACILTALITLTAATAGAQLLFHDGFDYTSSQLLAPTDGSAGQANVAYGYNWYYAGVGGNPPGVASGGLSYNSVPGYSGLAATTGNSASLGSASIGVGRIQFTPAGISSGTLYYSGLLQVNSVATTIVNGALIGGFNNVAAYSTAASTVPASLRIRTDPVNPSLLNIGIGMNSGTVAGNIAWSGGLDLVGSTVFVVASYQFVAGSFNDIASLWINPSQSDFGAQPTANLIAQPGGSVSDAITGGVISFNLRNVSSAGIFGAQFDEARIGTSWADVMPTMVPEPGAAVLLGLGSLVLLGWRRSRRS